MVVAGGDIDYRFDGSTVRILWQISNGTTPGASTVPTHSAAASTIFADTDGNSGADAITHTYPITHAYAYPITHTTASYGDGNTTPVGGARRLFGVSRG